MGWWGYGSDENDHTMDALGTVTRKNTFKRVLKRLRADLEKPRAREAFLGVAMIGLANGVSLPLAHLDLALRIAKEELDDKEMIGSFKNPASRRRRLRSEIGKIELELAQRSHTAAALVRIHPVNRG